MQLNNPLQMNDWEIKKFLKVVLAVQLAMWGVIGLDVMGLHIPILRELIGFIYLTFVPGILILRIIKLHNLGNIETVLYSVGLSVATLMFTGFFMNMLYPLFGISGPISFVPLVITISAVVLVLCALSYTRDKDFSDPDFIDVNEVLTPPALFLCLVPFMAIFGTYLVNFHQNNILLMLLIVVLAIISLLIGFDKFIPKSLYPLAVFVIAISLLYHRWLISMYLTGYDVHHEYYLSNLVMGSFLWDPTIHFNTNAMLSIVMLVPIFSNICNMNLTWVLKIIYPLLFSLLPLGLYQVFRKQTNDKIAFLSSFFFISFFSFWTITSRRQWIAELFLVLLMLSMINKNMDKIKRSFLFILFGISLAVSHYGTAYIYMFCLVAAWPILVLSENPQMQIMMNKFFLKFNKKREKHNENQVPLKIDRTISSTFVLLFITFTLAWYMYVSNSASFNTIIRISDHIANSLFTDFLNPEAAEALDLIIRETGSIFHDIGKYLHLLSQFFIAMGILTLLVNRRYLKFGREYGAFSLLFFTICLASISVPYFSSSLNTNRLYHITLIFLAPFCMIGGITVFKMAGGLIKAPWTNESVRSLLKVLSVFLAIFLLFNSGFIFMVLKDDPGSIALSQEWIKDEGDNKKKAKFYTTFTPEQDVFSAKWLSMKRDDKEKIYATHYDSRVHPLTSYGMIPTSETCTLTNTTKEIIGEGSYVYLQYLNVIEGIGTDWNQNFSYTYNMTEIFYHYERKSKIYSNGCSEVYK